MGRVKGSGLSPGSVRFFAGGDVGRVSGLEGVSVRFQQVTQKGSFTHEYIDTCGRDTVSSRLHAVQHKPAATMAALRQ